jgi:hypothetical protein
VSKVTNQDILRALGPIHRDVAKTKAAVTALTMVVKGNGVKGHAQRLDGLETWRAGHPDVCPWSAAAVGKKIKRATMILGLVVAVLTTISIIANLRTRKLDLNKVTEELQQLRDDAKEVEP